MPSGPNTLSQEMLANALGASLRAFIGNAMAGGINSWEHSKARFCAPKMSGLYNVFLFTMSIDII